MALKKRFKRKSFRRRFRKIQYQKKTQRTDKRILKWKRKKRQTYQSKEDLKRKELLKLQALKNIELERQQKNIGKREERQVKRTIRRKGIQGIQEKPIISYLKQKHIAKTTELYNSLNIRRTYERLLDDAMTKPKDFKGLIIGQMDKLKHLLKIEMEFTSMIGKQPVKVTQLDIRNHTLEEIEHALKESGIYINEIFDSVKFQNFKMRLNIGQGGNRIATGDLLNIQFKIKLVRGK